MRTLVLAAAAASVLGFAGQAQAAQYIRFDGVSGDFGDDTVLGGNFTRTFTINLAQSGAISLTANSATTEPFNDLDFTSITFAGQSFVTGSVEPDFRFLNLSNVMAGDYQLVVNGRSGGNGAFAGTIAFTPSDISSGPGGAIPEPATWAMMILGFGAAGYSLRRRRALEVA